jgi:hypothetical protein
MRSLVLISLVGAAACGGDTGLVLKISAPDGPGRAARIEIVLANPDAIGTADGQLTGGMVRYYRQQSTTAAVDVAELDGRLVRIEGRDGKGDEVFVPFVFAYDDAIPQQARPPIAAGAVLDPQGLPLALEVPAGSILEATVSMIPLLAADMKLGVMSGQIAEIQCGSNSGAWRSGLAWQPPAGEQIRLLLPAPDAESKLDATARPLDLDCDGFVADQRDCDDLRARYNPGATESCDGEDTNCDGSHLAITQCDPPDADCGPGSTDGVLFCQDNAQGTPVAMCAGSPACRCQAGNPGPCSRCALAFEGIAPPFKPCAPALAKLSVGPCDALSPCLVEVIRDDGPWVASVAAGQQLEFKQSATVVTGEVWLRVKAELSSVMASPGASVGAVHLAISRALEMPRYVGIDLELAAMRTDTCVTTMGGPSGMVCNL